MVKRIETVENQIIIFTEGELKIFRECANLLEKFIEVCVNIEAEEALYHMENLLDGVCADSIIVKETVVHEEKEVL